jgi:UDPglucose 6-dehydrogenase
MKTEMKRKTVAVIGYGYVGKALVNFFKDHFDVLIYDVAQPDVSTSKDEINKRADLAVISVPTPMGDDGAADLSAVEGTFAWLKTPLVLIKSTIPPGTTESLSKKLKRKIAFSPEYIGEGKYPIPFWKNHPHPTDMKLHSFVIIGGEMEYAKKILNFFKRVLGAEATYQITTSTTAELVKYMENGFLATKVTFCNEFYDIAKNLGIDYDELRELWLLDGRNSRSHTLVYEDDRGFGGKCLPKDVNALVKASTKAGYKPKLLDAVLKVNEEIRSRQNGIAVSNSTEKTKAKSSVRAR